MNGDYVTHKDYQYRKENQAGDLMLIGGTGGTEYTFVVYYVNSATPLPGIPGFATTKIANVNLTVNAVPIRFYVFQKDNARLEGQ